MPVIDFENDSVAPTGWTNESSVWSLAIDQKASGLHAAKHTTVNSTPYGVFTSGNDSNSGACRVSASVRGTATTATDLRLLICLRQSGASLAAGTHYRCYMNFNAGLQLFRTVSGTPTQIGSTVGSSSTFAKDVWYRFVCQITSATVITLRVQRLTDLQWLNSSGTWVTDTTAATVALTVDDDASGSKITGVGAHGAGGLIVAGATSAAIWVDDIQVDYFTSAETATANADSASVFYSPWAWRLTGSGASAKQITADTGNYFKTKFTGNACALYFDTSNYGSMTAKHTTNPEIAYSIDGKKRRHRTIYDSDMITGVRLHDDDIVGTGTHTLQVWFKASTSTDDNWTTPVNSLIFTGFRLGTTYALASPDLLTYRLLCFGDSITRGAASAPKYASVPATDTRSITDGALSYVHAIAERLDAEVGIVGKSGQGYTVVGSGNVPSFVNAWDFYSDSQSRLSTGLLVPEPDFITINEGTNESAVADATVTAAIHTATANTGVLKDIRAAAGADAWMFVIVPFGQIKVTAITDAVDDYQADNPSDTKLVSINLGTDMSVGLTDTTRAGSSLWAYDGLHPNQYRHAQLGELVAYAMDLTINPPSPPPQSGSIANMLLLGVG